MNTFRIAVNMSNRTLYTAYVRAPTREDAISQYMPYISARFNMKNVKITCNLL